MMRVNQSIKPVKVFSTIQKPFITLSCHTVSIGIKLGAKDSMEANLKKVLIVGSAPDAVRAAEWDTSFFSTVVVINNAWKALTSWDCWIYPEDFPQERHPSAAQLHGKKTVTATDFVPVQNDYGGFVYAGGTMCFTAGYWALGALRPDVMAYLGCDMVYPTGPGCFSHFYGQGVADPLRADVTLQSLEAKSLRLLALAQRQSCTVMNLSERPSSRLMVPRTTVETLRDMTYKPPPLSIDAQAVEAALQAESQLGYWVPSGRYWEESQKFDKEKLQKIDTLWMATAPSTECEVA